MLPDTSMTKMALSAFNGRPKRDGAGLAFGFGIVLFVPLPGLFLFKLFDLFLQVAFFCVH